MHGARAWGGGKGRSGELGDGNDAVLCAHGVLARDVISPGSQDASTATAFPSAGLGP